MKEKILLGGYTKRKSTGVYSVLLDKKKAEIIKFKRSGSSAKSHLYHIRYSGTPLYLCR